MKNPICFLLLILPLGSVHAEPVEALLPRFPPPAIQVEPGDSHAGIQIRNANSFPVEFEFLGFSCDCTTVEIVPEELKGGVMEPGAIGYLRFGIDHGRLPRETSFSYALKSGGASTIFTERVPILYRGEPTLSASQLNWAIEGEKELAPLSVRIYEVGDRRLALDFDELVIDATLDESTRTIAVRPKLSRPFGTFVKLLEKGEEGDGKSKIIAVIHVQVVASK